MTKVYKCPHCGATGTDTIYDIFIIKQRRRYKDLSTGDVRYEDEGPDDYDQKFPVWTQCAKCKMHLFGEAKDYIIEVNGDLND